MSSTTTAGNKYLKVSESEKENNNTHWLLDIPFVLFRSWKTQKYVKAETLSLFSPKRIKANYEHGLSTAHSIKEIWNIEWLEGGHRTCRIRSTKDPNSFWAVYVEKDQSLHLAQEEFERNATTNEPFKLVDSKLVSPSVFYVAILDGKIAFQYLKTNQWLKVVEDTSIELCDSFQEDCQFIFAIKVSFFRPSILNPNVRLYLACSFFFFFTSFHFPSHFSFLILHFVNSLYIFELL